VHAPADTNAEVSSVVRGMSITSRPEVQVSAERAREMLADYAGLRIVRHRMQPLRARAFEMRYKLTAYDTMHIALAEPLGVPLLTDGGKLATAPGHTADVHQYPNRMKAQAPLPIRLTSSAMSKQHQAQITALPCAMSCCVNIESHQAETAPNSTSSLPIRRAERGCFLGWVTYPDYPVMRWAG
jgi:predicted nucleic acid-binding protein